MLTLLLLSTTSGIRINAQNSHKSASHKFETHFYDLSFPAFLLTAVANPNYSDISPIGIPGSSTENKEPSRLASQSLMKPDLPDEDMGSEEYQDPEKYRDGHAGQKLTNCKNIDLTENWTICYKIDKLYFKKMF